MKVGPRQIPSPGMGHVAEQLGRSPSPRTRSSGDVYVPPPKKRTSDSTPLRSLQELEQLTQEFASEQFHREGRFSELAGARWTFKPFKSDAYFFAISKKPLDILLGRNRYVVKYNPDAFTKGATAGGVRGVLAHEFSHAVVYRTEGLGGLLRTAFANIGQNPKSGPKVERQTDLQAIARGFGEQLKQYRQWLDKTLQNPEDVRIKHERYFTADEIDILIDIQKTNPKQIQEWMEDPPRLGELQAFQSSNSR